MRRWQRGSEGRPAPGPDGGSARAPGHHHPGRQPQVSVAWIGLDGDDVVVGRVMGGRQPRVALTVEADGTNPVGVQNHLILHGTARLVAGGAPELRPRPEVHLGPGLRFPPVEGPPAGHVIHVTATRAGGVGPWAG